MPRSNSSDRILAFIPAYNCAPQIPRVLAQFQTLPHGVVEEVLVVDNHSTDTTREAAIAAAAKLTNIKVRVVQNAANYGLGGSHKSAFSYAAANGFDYVIVLHGDDQGCIIDMLHVLQQGLHHKYDCCLGSRFMSGSKLKGYAFTRVIGNHVFNTLFTLVSRRRISDLGSGLNIFSQNSFADPHVQRYSDDLRFNCYFLLGLVALGKSFRFFPISWSEDDQISNVKMVSQSLKTLSILWEYLSSRKKFLSEDHRTTRHTAYTFRTLYSNVPNDSESPS